MEDDEVAPGFADELPVAPAQRLLGPPAILDQPRLADLGDDVPVDPQRPALGVGLDARARAREATGVSPPGRGAAA